ncbi:c-type cytochrome [Phenylobacterium sp. VNQ135]|uniref:c-type cytochrome n=1 Tax=Phenylobacterium sp. VNQ135 TaxID=3400922 RepID=UPI003C1006F2
MDRRTGRTVGLLASLLVAATPASAAEYALTCGGCHGAKGAGGPGAPRLAGRLGAAASTTEGRAYVAGVLLHGLTGPVVVDGRTVRSVMPAYGHLSDADIAELLNQVLRLAPARRAPDFTEREIARQRRLGARTPDAMAMARRRLRPIPGF